MINLTNLMQSDSIADLIDEVTLMQLKDLYEMECSNEQRVDMQEDKDDSIRMQAHLLAVIEYMSVYEDYKEWLDGHEETDDD